MTPTPKPVNARLCAPFVPWPSPQAHKFSRGTVLVVGGSFEYPGAPVLAARAAVRSGAGYVRIAAPEPAAAVAKRHVCSIPVSSCATGTAFSSRDAAGVVGEGAKSDVFVIGPGLGRGEQVTEFVGELLAATNKAVVLDADALNALASCPEILSAHHGGAVILTPHEGEAARLLRRPVADRTEDALAMARRFGAVVVLKGPDTVIAGPSGELWVYTGGGPELAKAGTGDVLAGMVGAFAAQGPSALQASQLAVYLHGRAGALAAERLSALSVMPEDVIECIGTAVLELR